MSSFECVDCDVGMKSLKKESVDLIFTDPPYVKDQYEKAYTVLARHAKRILKPSGYLISYCGHYYLPDVHDIFRKVKLVYYWQVSQLNTGSLSLIHHRNILAGYKPILIYQKAPLNPTNKIFKDVIAGRHSKNYHAWEQSIQEALHLLSRFCKPGDKIVDPFTGSGTTLLAAKLLGLDYTGFEIDPYTYATACRRLEQQPLDLTQFIEVEA